MGAFLFDRHIFESPASPDIRDMNSGPDQSISQLIRRLWHHISPRRRTQFSILFLLMIFASFAEFVSIGALLPFLSMLTAPETVFGHPLGRRLVQILDLAEPGELMLPLTIAFAGAALFSGAMRLILMWGQIRLSHAVGADLSLSMYSRTLYQNYAVHVARNSSEVIAGVSAKAKTVVANTVMPILTIISSCLMSITILTALIAIDPMVATIAFAGFGSIYALVILFTHKRLVRNSYSASRESNQVIKAMQEGLGGIRDILIDGTQGIYCKVFAVADQRLRRAQSSTQMISGSPRYVIEALGMVLVAMLAFLLVRHSDGIATTIPVLGALALGAQRVLPMLQQAYAGWSAIRGGQVSLSDAIDLLDQPLPVYAFEPREAPIPFEHGITLNKLSFRYASEVPWVLHEVDLAIPKGSRVGFIGPTGSGKSTLLDIIMGLLHSTEGSLSVDGVAIDPQNHRAWQAHIAHVPQTIFLADTSIAENIAFGIPPDQIDLDRVREAAERSQIAQIIETWEGQYHTVVGERGVRLSGGQRQRIGIARALYKRADVIVLDEATSALDNDTEGAVMQAIEGLGDELTVLIVAHRLTTLKNCTQVIELVDGKIKRSGKYREIVGGDGH